MAVSANNWAPVTKSLNNISALEKGKHKQKEK